MTTFNSTAVTVVAVSPSLLGETWEEVKYSNSAITITDAGTAEVGDVHHVVELGLNLYTRKSAFIAKINQAGDKPEIIFL